MTKPLFDPARRLTSPTPTNRGSGLAGAALLLWACGGPSSPSAPTSDVAVPPPDVAAQQHDAPNPDEGSITAQALHRLAEQPHVLSRWLDSQRGLTVVRSLHCMRSEEDQVESNRHVCDDVEQALGELHTNLQERARRALGPEGGGITCAPTRVPEVSECVLPPDSECVSKFFLYFKGTTLLMLVERDDWQSPEPVRVGLDRQILEQLETLPGCQRAVIPPGTRPRRSHHEPAREAGFDRNSDTF